MRNCSISGNAVGLSLAEWQALDAGQQGALRAKATQQLLDAGAHYVVDSVAELLPAREVIEGRLRAGEQP